MRALLSAVLVVGVLAAKCSLKRTSEEDVVRKLEAGECHSLNLERADPDVLARLESAVLGSARQLRAIDVSGNYIGDDGAMILARLLPQLPALVDVEAANNRIGDHGAKALAAALAMGGVALQELELERNEIGDAGATALFLALEGGGSLRELDLSGNRIGDAGAFALEQALGTERATLSEVNLHGNRLSMEAVALLSELPGTLRRYVRLGLDAQRPPTSSSSSSSSAQGSAADGRPRPRPPMRDAREAARRSLEAHTSSLQPSAGAATAPDTRRDLLAMDEAGVASWIGGIHPSLQRYAPLFHEHAVNGAMAAALTDEDLEGMGVENGMHRRRILHEIDSVPVL
jgi:hypothetical protein